jgi:hypothetical protein
MIKIDHRIIITGMIILGIMFTCMIMFDHENFALQSAIIATIGLCVGVVLPTPKMSHRRGYLIW